VCGWRAAGTEAGEVGSARWRPSTVPAAWVKNGLNRFKKLKRSKNIQTFPNFDSSKFDLTKPQKFKIKYGFEDLGRMNNLLHRNFFRFGRDLHLKI
jgi:hypothetical protein